MPTGNQLRRISWSFIIPEKCGKWQFLAIVKLLATISPTNVSHCIFLANTNCSWTHNFKTLIPLIFINSTFFAVRNLLL